MEPSEKIKCPNCGSENVVIQKRGYSFGRGLLFGVLLVVAFWLVSVLGSDTFSSLDEYGQYGYTAGLLLQSVPVFIIGLLFGLSGKNKLVAQCLKCKCKFDPSAGISE
mgnify:CR=1 FL=1